MSDSLRDITHRPFKYIFIPQNIEDAVEVRTYEGAEGGFQDLMRLHFSTRALNGEEKAKLSENLQQEVKARLGENKQPANSPIDAESLTNLAQNRYQIIPLTLPTKANDFEAVNAYIDNVGRIKGLSQNARASRITSDDICGDCFISKTFDDEDVFKRIDFALSDFQMFLEHPPSKSGRWSAEKAMQMAMPDDAQTTSAAEPSAAHCANCFKERASGTKLSKCGGCRKVAYCSVDCQKADWTYHKRLCQKG
eukprot:Gregarina_sp_Pseudo_9__4528@NODE_46_length_5037_cov_13_741297_g43_i0_p4_GENE_NODE_46_length_5037_cov_13_741297_g43_i0NODE_46_length_5037_cov_13_741297_g43_i0_p4_ORF_typecomplete_len251_score48_73zfMYND/PF01753_18/7_9e13zfC6H2/PF15801_5/0_007Meleagrin/PF08189_11/3_2e03Meleagrin/PF08189_11/0_042DUF3846/PF12957_7/0_13zfC2HCIx2C/PF10782_9/5_8zfC2HCIx2C/PF10782_9/7_5e02_NODE_46_length_5037_cov_13_741297_g43_i017112463